MSWRIKEIETGDFCIGDSCRTTIEIESMNLNDLRKVFDKGISSIDYSKEYDLVEKGNPSGVKLIYFNTKTNELCIKWNDDTITSAKCSDKDEFDVYIGFALAYTKKMFGSNTKMRKFVDEHYKTSNKKLNHN